MVVVSVKISCCGGAVLVVAALVQSTSMMSSSRRHHLVRTSSSSSSSNSNVALPLATKDDIKDNHHNIFKGVIACLSGQSYDSKEYIHSLLTKDGGGSAMGNFDPRYVTHLILDEGVGSKYDHWI